MSPSRTPEARSAKYNKNRTPRLCRCGSAIKLGSRNRMCDVCRETPNPKCKKCKAVKPLSKFSLDSTRPSGRFPWCMDCQSGSTSKFQNPEDELLGGSCPLCDTALRGHANRKFCSVSCKGRAQALKKKYGLEVSQYRSLVAITGGVCPICECTPTVWHVDHNHETGLVTGVVCSPCNIGLLAYSKHSLSLAESLVSYLINPPASLLGIIARAPDTATGNKESSLHKKWSYSHKYGKR